MATTKKSAAMVKKTAPHHTPASRKIVVDSHGAVAKQLTEMDNEELVAANIAALSKTVAALGSTLDLLVQKAAGMAHHIIATEEMLAEIVTTTGLDLAHVNARIRAKIAAGTDNEGNANPAIDVAASIASPLSCQCMCR